MLPEEAGKGVGKLGWEGKEARYSDKIPTSVVTGSVIWNVNYISEHILV